MGFFTFILVQLRVYNFTDFSAILFPENFYMILVFIARLSFAYFLLATYHSIYIYWAQQASAQLKCSSIN